MRGILSQYLTHAEKYIDIPNKNNEEAYWAKIELLGFMHQAKLYLNENEKKPKDLIRIMEELPSKYSKKGNSSHDYQFEKKNITSLMQDILKEEWNRVRDGEILWSLNKLFKSMGLPKWFHISRIRLFWLIVIFTSGVLVVTFVGNSIANQPSISQGQTQSTTASNTATTPKPPPTQPALTLPSFLQQIDIGSWTTAIATLILAILTGFYVLLTKRILEAQSNPCVIVSVVHDQDRPSILQLVVKNIGSGLAHDITFEFSKPLPNHAWGITIENAKEAEVMKNGPLILGIPALGPGEERKIDWGQYGGLINNIGENPITATSFFKNNGKKMKPVKSYLDVKSFEGTNASESPIAKIANHIESISKEVNHISTGFRKPQIRVVEMPSEEKENDKA